MARRLLRVGRWTLALTLAMFTSAAAQPSGDTARSKTASHETEPRLYDRVPFDVIVVDDRDKTEVEVEPLQINGSLDPAKHPENEKLVVRLLEFPGQEYEIHWRDIAEIRRFEHVLLAKANELVDRRRFDEAFDYFNYLHVHFPRMRGLNEAINRYLFAEAKALFEKKDRRQARVPLLALYDRQPDFPGLREMFESLLAEQADPLMQQARYAELRALLQQFSRLYPQSELVATYRSQLQAVASRMIDEARRHLEQNQWREARRAAHRAMSAWEENAEARRVWAEAYRRYPLISVAVRQLSVHPAWRIDDWAARRVLRLVERPLFEPVGYGEEGTQYQCPLGRVEAERLGMRLSIDLRHDLRWSPDVVLTGLDVSRELLAAGQMSDGRRGSTAGDTKPMSPLPVWRPHVDWVDTVGVEDVFRVTIDWRRRHLRPESLLQTVIRPLRYRLADRTQFGLGPYSVDEATDGEVRFTRRSHYFASQEGQAQEIIERRYDDADAAMTALRSGEVMLIDRVPPWMLATQAENDPVVIAPYAAPTVHCLAIESDDPRLADRSFRRAMVYALRRQKLLNDVLLQGAEIAGCQVLSAPLPTGYAYDPSVEPRTYDPLLAFTLVAVADRRAADPQPGGQTPSGKENTPPRSPTESANISQRATDVATTPDLAAANRLPTASEPKHAPRDAPAEQLVLAHPPSDVARRACRLIREQFAAVGIPVVLREIDGRSAEPVECDLRYVEFMLSEPIVDVPRMLADPRWAKGPGTDYLRLAVRRLRDASDWNEARTYLREIHRILHDDLRFIPLWQLTEFFAYRRDLTGIGSRPMMFYQQVESWQSEWVELAKRP